MADNKLLGAGSLYFRGNEITKAYMGNNLVWEKSEEAGIDYSKEYFYIADVDDRDYVSTLVRETCKALPTSKRSK